MQNNPLFSTKRGRMILFGILAFVVVGLLAILIALLIKKDDSGWQREETAPQIDSVSGETIWNIDQENELEPSLQLIGFYQLVDFGFMSEQYKKIIDTVEAYLGEKYPNVMRASYRKNSFKYLDNKWIKSSFEFVTSDGKKFVVMLDTGGSLSNISVEIIEA